MNSLNRSIVAALAAVTVCAASPAFAQPANVDELLALVPPADPPADSPLKLVPEMVGTHPRLLWTDEEAKALRKQVDDSDVLKVAYAQTRTLAERYGLPPDQMKSMVSGDTPALVGAGGRMPSMPLIYAMDGDDAIREKMIDILTRLADEPHWASTGELDSSMGAGNVMFSAGLLFDAVAEDLEPAKRKEIAQKLLTQARRMYYLGHLELRPGIHYWQQDPQNNHRWHRAAGMASCILAIAGEDGIQEDWLLQEFKKEMDFLVKWQPAEGDSHEGPGYQTFGFHYLVMAATMMDRVVGTEYLKAPVFANAWQLQVYSFHSGRKSSMAFGDDQNRENNFGGDYNGAFMVGPRLSRNADAQAAMVDRFKQAEDEKIRGFTYPWMVLYYFDATLKPGDAEKLPVNKLFADLGVVYLRDDWSKDAVQMMFKCGPLGGYKLNEYRNENNFHYINIAHDDPDANSFALDAGKGFVVHPGVYATKKLTKGQAGLLVDGAGQIYEGDSYTQPVKDTDMTTLAYLTSWKQGQNNRVIVEGEAANAYKDLKQFRRSVIWMPGDYILMLDNVVADGEHDIAWTANAPEAQFTDPKAGTGWFATEGGDKMPIQMLSDKPIKGIIDNQILSGRWGSPTMHIAKFHDTTQAIRFVCAMDAWGKDVKATFEPKGDGTATITVKGDGIDDTWQWTAAKDLKTPSTLTGTRDGKPLMELTAADKAPHGEE